MTETEIVAELLAMVVSDQRDRDDENRSPFLESNRAKTRELGQQLWQLGGIHLMQRAWGKIPRHDQRELEHCWDGIGEWRS